jgi:peptidoglycan/xylan/chitin deacetylase (PgdA/CDA1 family)
MNAKAVPVLMYHHVAPRPGLVTVKPQTFAAHMERLARAGYTALTADRFLAWMQGRVDVPHKSVLITFDDGYLDNYVHAYPTLKRLGLHAVVFLVTGWIGEGSARANAGGDADLPDLPSHKACKQAIAEGRADDAMMRWSEIELMESDGTIEFHSHTHTHVRWDELHENVSARLDALRHDLAQSRDTLRQRLGRESRHLCWPWGHFDTSYQTLARELGFDAQYTVERGLNLSGDDPLRIKRIDTKERPAGWLARQLFTYRSPRFGRTYLALRGR